MFKKWLERQRQKANADRIMSEVKVFLSRIEDNTEMYERTIDFKTSLEIYIENLKNK